MDYLNAKLNKDRKLKIKEIKIEEFEVASGIQKKLILDCEEAGRNYTISEGVINGKNGLQKIGLWIDIDENGMINSKNRGVRKLLENTNSESLQELIEKEVPVIEFERYLTLKLD